MNKIIKNFLFLVIGIILLPFAICVCLCSVPFIVYRRFIKFFKVGGLAYNELWFINKRLVSFINYLMEILL